MKNVNHKKLEINKSVLMESYCRQIEERMNTLKLEYLSQWERNHNLNPSVVDEKIKKLQAEKEKFCAQLRGSSNKTVSIDPADFSIAVQSL